MAKIETAIRDAIARGARKHVRQATSPLRREVRRLRGLVRQLRQDLTAVRELTARWERARQGPELTEQEVTAARLSPGLIRKLRTRLGLSQARLARLVGVSGAAVVQWERGRSAPAGRNRGALVALRRVGRREVKRRLADLGKPAPRPARRGRRKTRRTPSRRRK